MIFLSQKEKKKTMKMQSTGLLNTFWDTDKHTIIFKSSVA